MATAFTNMYIEIWHNGRFIGVFKRTELIVKVYRPDMYISVR